MIILVSVLIVIDIVLLAALFYLNNKRSEYLDVIKDFNDERKVLTSIRNEVNSDLASLKSESKSFYEKLTILAAEAELEIKQGKESLKANLKETIEEITPNIENPIKEMTAKQISLEKTLRKAEKTKTLLNKSIANGEQLITLISKNIPYEQLIEEIKDRKYRDARQLIGQGLSPLEVSKELGISESEVRIIAGLSLA